MGVLGRCVAHVPARSNAITHTRGRTDGSLSGTPRPSSTLSGAGGRSPRLSIAGSATLLVQRHGQRAYGLSWRSLLLSPSLLTGSDRQLPLSCREEIPKW